MSNYVERHLYDAGGHTGSTYYIRIIDREDSKVWDKDNEVLKDVSLVSWVESAIMLIEEGLTGVFPILIPLDERTIENIAVEEYNERYVDLTTVEKAAVVVIHSAIKNLPGGTYDIVVYRVVDSEGVPAHDDNVEKQWEFKHGSIFGF